MNSRVYDTDGRSVNFVNNMGVSWGNVKYGSTGGGAPLTNWLNNSDSFGIVGVDSKTGVGGGGKLSVLGIQFGVAVNAYAFKRSGTISSNGLTSKESKISNIAVNYAFFGVEYERDWTGKNDIGSFDLGPVHFESNNYPVLRIFSVSGQVIGGGNIDIDLNLGMIITSRPLKTIYPVDNQLITLCI
jgi:hypothetical protein